jgi:hypothetical protein
LDKSFTSLAFDMLKTTPIRPHLDDIDIKINAAAGLQNFADVIAESKKQIFDILQTELAEGIADEALLKGLQEKLHKKKDVFEKDLGLGTVGFRDNADIAKLRDKTQYKTFSRNNDALKNKILQTLQDFQHLDIDKKKRTLFGGKSLDIADVTKNLSGTDISQVLNATTNVDTEITNFVKNVRKNQNPFLIQTSKLYTKPDDSQREIAIRMALYLYRIYYLADKGKINNVQAAHFEQVIDDQIQKVEIPKFKGIYNVKKELEYVEPEYAYLEAINKKAGNIDKGSVSF